MDRIRITGGKALHGKVEVSGAKNAALPILFSSLLTEENCVYTRVPNLQDIHTTNALLAHMGVECVHDPVAHQVSLRAGTAPLAEAPYDLVRKMRASVVVLGPLLARHGYAKVSLPGGCAIGARPINYHLTGLERLGAEITIDGGYVIARAKKLRGARVNLEFPSVGATENILMAAVLADGETLMENCAQEPEIADLARALISMGAQIEGAGTDRIRIQGKSSLKGARHEIMGDRIEAGTFAAAALATRGSVEVQGIAPDALESVLLKFEETGAKVVRLKTGFNVESQGRSRSVDVTTLPFPGFPTDMQAQFMALMCVADGVSVITENIFENRFMHVPELARLGCDIQIRGNTAIVRGKTDLKGAPLMATDLRASASLVLAGLVAQGETVVSRIYHLDRGYEGMERKLASLGAQIERLKD